MSANLTAAEERSRDAIRQAILLIITATLILTVLGVVMVFSATSVSSISLAFLRDDPALRFSDAQRQLMFAVLGIIALPIIAIIPASFYQRMIWPIFVLGIALQMLILSPLGIDVNGNRNWVSIAGFVLQPSEFLKLAAALWLAVMIGRLTRDDLSVPKKVLVPSGAGAMAAILAVMAGQDMGTAIIYVMMFAIAYWIAGIPGRWFAGAGLFIGVASVLLVALQRSRLNRIIDYFQNVFVLPDIHEPTQADYAMWAFGTGGVGGVGLGASREKWNYLPEAHNDFIFAVIGEELGFFGALAVIVLYIMLGFGLVRIVIHHNAMWVRYFAAMIAMWLVGQAILNMMVVSGVLPVFGVPLPFISQGGSAMVACLAAVGVTVSGALSHPGVASSFRFPRMSFRSSATLRSTR